MRSWGCRNDSVGDLWQRLTTFAQALPQDLPTGAQMMVWLADEVFTAGQPILWTVGAISQAEQNSLKFVPKDERQTTRSAVNY